MSARVRPARVIEHGRVRQVLSNGEAAYMPARLLSGIPEEEIANVAALLRCQWSTGDALDEAVSSADLRDVLMRMMRELFINACGDVPMDI